MRTRRFGRLGFEVSELALGTWGLSGEAYGVVYEPAIERLVELAVELGITLFETADVYGNGAMEKLLGDTLDPKTTRVVTKIGTFRPPREANSASEAAVKRFDPRSLREALDRSRDRLKREIIDVVLLHNPPAAAVASGEAAQLLRDERHQGRILGWGVSAGSREVAEAALDQGADAIELAYNLFCPRNLHPLTDRLGSTDTAVLARSVLAHGLLAGHWAPNKMFFEGDHRRQRWTEQGLRYRIGQLHAVRRLVGGDVLTMRAAALRFVLSNLLVSSAALGVRSQTQLRQLVREAGDGPEYLPPDLLARLPKILETAGIEL